MKYIECGNRLQQILFPERLDDLVSENNPVRFINAFVDLLDLDKIGFTKTNLIKELAGRPCYSPECLLKLYIYGYFKKIRSSRKMMEMCNINIEVMWLIGRLAPDFRTISDFRKENESAIKDVFKSFVKICVDMKLYNTEVGVQDGSKFRAVNSKDNNVTEPKLLKKLELAEEKINKYFEEMDKYDREEIDSPAHKKEEIKEKIQLLMERKEQIINQIAEMNKEGVTQKSFTDPESKLMKTANGGFDVCYNAQILVDPESHLIGAFEITNNCNDMGLLSSITTKAKDELGVGMMEVVADKGYEDKADMLNCIMNGTIPHIPSKSGKEFYEFEVEYKETDISDDQINSTKPEAIKICLEAGVIPNVYKDKGLEASIREVEENVIDETSELLFTLNEEGTAVECPNGSRLSKVSKLHNKGKTRYVNRSACKKCTDKCTTSKFKQVDLKEGQTELHGKKPQKERRVVKKVVIRLTPNKEKILNRKCVVEHPFGTVKRWQDGSYLLLKGKNKAGADLALLFLAYNIKRVIKMVGVLPIIEKMRRIIGVCLKTFSNQIQFLKALYSKPLYLPLI
jgi:transposase